MLKNISITLILLAAITLASGVKAQVDLEELVKPEKGKPIKISSENMIIKNEENLAIFTNNVEVSQGQMNLRASEVRLHTIENFKTKKSKFKLIEAFGDVSFKSEGHEVISNKAIYNVITGDLTLSENVRMKDDERSVLQGQVFKYNINTGNSKLSTATSKSDSNLGEKVKSSGRVRAVFTPGDSASGFTVPTNPLNQLRGTDEKNDNDNKNLKGKEN